LETEGVEPTNNRAARILRPAAIARKVSHCLKNSRGAEAFAAFVTICPDRTQEGQTESLKPSRFSFLRLLPLSGANQLPHVRS
jgi:hypothetical protein